jgi:hypothetical protein
MTGFFWTVSLSNIPDPAYSWEGYGDAISSVDDAKFANLLLITLTTIVEATGE